MIASVREPCLGLWAAPVWLAFLLAGCGGASGAAPRTAAVLLDAAAARAEIARALRGRGVSVEVVRTPAGSGADPVAAARRELARATEAQQSFREAEALEILSRAESLVAAQGVGPAERVVLADLGFLRAWLHLSAGRTAEAEREAGRASIFADPGAPDPARYPPEVVALFARVASAPRATGTLRIDVRGGDGAEVRLDGRSLGGAPLEAGGLPAGSHTVAIEAPGHARIADRVEVPAGGSVARTYTLAPRRAPDLARVALSRGPESLAAARQLAVTLSVDGVLLARAESQGGRVVLSGRWVLREGAERRVDGRGESTRAAAEDLARRLTVQPSRSAWAPALWIVGGVVVVAAAVGVGVAVAVGGDESGSGGSVRCCVVP
jgi:hypothetical protein